MKKENAFTVLYDEMMSEEKEKETKNKVKKITFETYRDIIEYENGVIEIIKIGDWKNARYCND